MGVFLINLPMADCSYTSNHKEVQFSVLVVLCEALLLVCAHTHVCSDAKSGLQSIHGNLSLSLNAGALLLRPESLSVCRGVHALP